MATLTVSSNTSFVGQSFSPMITLIDFTNATGTTVTASFNGNQFNDIDIARTVTVDGSVGTNKLNIGMRFISKLDISGFTFTNWLNSDSITITGSTLANSIVGSSRNDVINGDAGNDTVRGGLGTDILNGGSGDDTFVYGTGESPGVGSEVINGGTETDTIRIDAAGTFDFVASTVSSIEQVVFQNTTGFALAVFDSADMGGTLQSITGSAGQNRIRFSGGSIDLSGVAFNSWTDGTDIVEIQSGGAGTFTGTAFGDEFRDVGGAVTFNAGGGNDKVIYLATLGRSFSGDTLDGGSGFDVLEIQTFDTGLDMGQAASISNFEKFLFTGSSSYNGGASFLQMAGVQEIEEQIVAFSMNIKATTGTAAENLDLSAVIFTGFDKPLDLITISGNDGANDIKGGRLNETINAAGGDDVVSGNGGADTMDGGAGNDTLSYDQSAAGVKVELGSGIGKGGDAEGDTNVNFENLIGSTKNDTLTGDTFDNVMTGGDGADRITGGAGADALDGGLGNDTVVYSGSTSSVNIDLLASTATGGDALNDTITGFENIDGSNQSDGLTGSDAANLIRGAGASDLIVGNGGADNLQGGDGDDTISGNAGADKITGGAGQDAMTGGGAADTFIFQKVTDSGPGAAQRDTIDDFAVGVDKIDLSAIDAIPGGADNAFVFLTAEGAAFSLTQPEVQFSFSNGNTIVSVNIDADATPEMRIVLTGTVNLTTADFVL